MTNAPPNFADWIRTQEGLNLFREARKRLARGEDREALELLRELHGTCRAPAAAELLAHTLFAQGEKDEASAVCLSALGERPDAPELNVLLGQFLMEKKDFDGALARFAMAPKANVSLLNRHGLHRSRAASPVPSSPGGVLATSIPPVNAETHGRCIRSWLRQGFRVISVNTASELAVLAHTYPEVEFIEASRDARESTGKPCVFIDDILEALALQPEPVCGIVNADILFLQDDGLGDRLRQAARNRFVFGSRMDVDNGNDTTGRMYHVGFDYFLFPTAWSREFDAGDMAMGTPWWDYTLPLSCLERQRPISRVAGPVALHERHALNWSLPLGWQNGLRVLKRLMPQHFGLLTDDVLDQHNEGCTGLLAGLAAMLADTLNTRPEPLLLDTDTTFLAPFDAQRNRYPFPTTLIVPSPGLP